MIDRNEILSPLPAEQRLLIESRRVIAHLDTPESNVFRVLSSQVMGKLRARSIKDLAVVGALPGIGKTTIAVNLALSIAVHSSEGAVLVDLDLRKPKLGWCFDQEVPLGVGDVLAGTSTVRDIASSSGFQGLTLLPGRPFSSAGELCSSGKFERLFSEIREAYPDQVIVCDLPPILSVADALSFVNHAASLLLVVEDAKTTKTEIDEMQRLLADSYLLGAVVNKFRSIGSTPHYYKPYYRSEE